MTARFSSSFRVTKIRGCHRPLPSIPAPLYPSYHNLMERRMAICNIPQSRSKRTSAINNANPRYEAIEDIEPFERYTAGGYLPVRLGDKFHSSRYQIVHKLGHGASSTTWLARDESRAKYVALKITVSNLDRPVESAILRKLRDEVSHVGEVHVGSAMIPEILDEFEVQGSEIHGVRKTHHCFTMTPARMSLSEAREASGDRLFQPAVAHAIAAQLVQAVAFMHSCGFVHGDLHEGNILLRLPKPINDFTPEQIYERYGDPELEEVKRLDGQPLDPWVPSHGVVPIWFGDASNSIFLEDCQIFLSDFSESFQPNIDVRQSSHMPYILRSPEMFLEPTRRISFEAEIWSLACAIFAIMGQRPLFDTWFPSKDRVLEEQVETLGRLPDMWWAKWANRSQCFDDELQKVDGTPAHSLNDRIESSIQLPRREAEMTAMNEEEKQAFLLLLRSMLSFEPEERPSAQQVLGSNWMQNWAMPASESMKDKPRP